MKWTTWAATLVLVIALAVTSSAQAAGGPVPPVQGSAIGVAGSPARYGAFGAGAGTIVKRLAAGDVPTGAQLRVAGHYGIPGVDYGGTLTGLSADGRTLVLARLPGNRRPRTTRLLVVNTPRLTIRARITLPGWSTVDAISPDGRWLYLIHYPSSDISRYEVRAYDLRSGRMLAKPVVDPADRGEAMTGFPVNRVMSAGARWAYTLYLRPSKAPFIHALDTIGHRAVCVDLPSLTATDVGNGHLGLTPGGGFLHVDIAGVTRVLVNTRTFTVISDVTRLPSAASSTAPARPATHTSASHGPATHKPASHAPATHRSAGVPWALLAGLLVVLAALVVAATRRTRPGHDPDEASARGTSVV